MSLLTLSRTSDPDTAAVPESLAGTNPAERQAADAGKHQRGTAGHGRPPNVSIQGLAESVSEYMAMPKDPPLPASPPLSPRSIGSRELVEAKDGRWEQCIRVKCKQMPSRYPALSVQQIANELFYQDKDYLPAGPPNYIRIPTALIENANGTDYVRVLTTIVDLVKEVEARRARQIAGLELEASRHARSETMRWLKEKVFLTFLALLCLAIVVLRGPGQHTWFLLLVSTSASTAMIAAVSGTVRDLCQRNLEDIGASFAEVWHITELLAFTLCAMTFVHWHSGRVSRARGLLLAFFKTVNWIDRQGKNVAYYAINYRYGILITVVLTGLIYCFESLTGWNPTTSLRLPSTKLYNGGTTTRLMQTYHPVMSAAMDQLPLSSIPNMAGLLEQGRLMTLGLVGALVALSAVAYRAVRRWQRRTDLASTGFIYNSIVKLVVTVEHVQRTLVATEHYLTNILSATARYIRKHWFAIFILVLIIFSIADYAFGLNLRAKLGNAAALVQQRFCETEIFYFDIRSGMFAILVGGLLHRRFLPILEFICQGLLDILQAIFVVAWRWPWKVIVRCVVGLILGTIWLAGTITLGIWGFYTFLGPVPGNGPVPVLDMLIKYPNGEEALPVRVIL